MVVAYLAKVGVKLELEPMDYPSWLSRLSRKNHTAGLFFSNGHGTPIEGIRKNFAIGQFWNAHMMSDPNVDKTLDDITQNPNLTDKQITDMLKKLVVYVIDQAPAIILPQGFTYTVWWPWVKNYYGEWERGQVAV